MAGGARCGECDPCRATPPRPCVVWVRRAVARVEREMRSESFARVMRDFDNRHED